jgi:hypothetical protein
MKYAYDTVLLKQKKWTVLDITGFFFRMITQVKAEVHYIQYVNGDIEIQMYGIPFLLSYFIYDSCVMSIDFYGWMLVIEKPS